MAAIRLDISDSVATITLDRPDKLNAFTTAMGNELIEAFDTCDRDDAVRAVVLTGAGRAFCAGADLSAGAETFVAPEEAATEDFRDGGGELVLRMFESRKPIIAAINGPAVGVGVTMTLAADFRLAADNARIGFVFNRRGIVPESCSSWFLPRLVSMQKALDWVYSGRLVDAAEAHEAGLFYQLYPAESLLEQAYALARRITEHSAPVSVALSRQMLWRGLGADHPMIAHRVESRGIHSRGASADAKEGVSSFLEKRPARYPDSVARDLPDIFGDDLPVPPFRR
ncbi:crotonase/enoyl-CoA hydratase family protein [Nocardia zapadnayensis]|uniref:crotonase/enoyl-CoA hydratase family protein n=1 Tax=Nocardia rhamnosiphila TaxID=426716 RepID=UPI00224768DE|nr:crotonase/enoyl-CoA hydratase family protein [Nocardia zapadnayensis]MCX0273085.1 crotonase/enoyl-CoA hydratase family protein [Nocardia zapadnayensis]